MKKYNKRLLMQKYCTTFLGYPYTKQIPIILKIRIKGGGGGNLPYLTRQTQIGAIVSKIKKIKHFQVQSLVTYFI